MTQHEILKHAREMVRREGLINLTREKLAQAAGIPDGSFLHVAGMSFTEMVSVLQNDATLMAEQPKRVAVDKGRTNPLLRYTHILGVAVERARTVGYDKLTRAQVAEAAGVSETLISHYFGTMDELKERIMDEAVRRGVVEIIAQGLAAGNETARAASPSVKQAAFEWMA